MRFLYLLVLPSIFFAASIQNLPAEDNSPVILKKKITGQDKFEIDFNYEYLDPSSTYGSWNNVSMRYYQKYSQDLTLVYGAALFSRPEGSAGLLSLAAYKDWSPSFYTYSQFSMGTDSDYLPKYRIDNDFNFKFGEKKQWVGLIGLTYIEQHDVHSDFIVSLGLTYYAARYNISYRYFYNTSNPGAVHSETHLLSIGYGAEKEYWTYLDLSYGNQAYQSTSTNTISDENAWNIKLKHRHWINENSGIYGSIGYTKLDNSYTKTLFSIGYFQEF